MLSFIKKSVYWAFSLVSNSKRSIKDQSKPWLLQKKMRIRFDKVNGFIRVYDEPRYLTLFELGKYHAILNRIRYLVREKVVLHMFLIIMFL